MRKEATRELRNNDNQIETYDCYFESEFRDFLILISLLNFLGCD